MTDPATIAQQLSPAARRVLSGLTGEWSERRGTSVHPNRKLYELGCAECAVHPDPTSTAAATVRRTKSMERITPLGEAVRAVFIEMAQP